MSNTNPVRLLRTVGWLEGASYLLLLGVAMPLKYFAGLPQAVKYVGWAHGVLFVAFAAALAWAAVAARWPLGRAALVFVASLVPAGTFLIDRRMTRYVEEFGRDVPQPR